MATYSAIETGIAKALGLASAMVPHSACVTEIVMALHSAIEKVLGLAPVKERGLEIWRECGLESGSAIESADAWVITWEASAFSTASGLASRLERAWAFWRAHGLVICSATWKARG